MNSMKMTEQSTEQRERLSALMDDGLTELQARQLLRDLQESEPCREVWQAYHANQAALHGAPQVDVLAGVNAALDAEEAKASYVSEVRHSRWIGFAQGALAAGVCLAGILALWPLAGQSPQSGPDTVTTQLPPADATAYLPRMDSYWSRHAQFATVRTGGRWDETERSHGDDHGQESSL
ncbi:MAG: sigma-E factor negative regulatory protein [Natronospirillum sp.]|uniref:sigma-E factor negative regulatory protein n=1 Tax=Natronospirillum sp. TaxID=2812955 RepID=UPI0025EACEEE|nr:sigma-E factor negative regulatory protein [Natronospirillum sp.]MCH8550480.1 sigma-E factor negative regulatory protein [Natronospirillum sp.]